MKLLLAHCLFTALGPLVAQAHQEAPPANEVLLWNRLVTEAFAAAHCDPVTESRALAIVQLAVHDAQRTAAADTDAAIAVAAHDVAVALLPATRAALDAELARAMEVLGAGDDQSRGIDAGRAAAAAALASRAHDGSDRKVEMPAGTRPGEYRPTPPDFTPAWMAQWGSVTPFCLRSAAQFRPSAPPAVGSELAASDLEQSRRLGGQRQSQRNDEQSQIACFWYENSPQGWNRIARVVAQSRRLDAADSARLLALVNLAMADGFIASFDAKYQYGYWRPATAIRAAGSAEWLSFLDTPPVPDYPSAHAVLGAAAATVLARFCGTDYVAFETTSGQPFAGITRRFWSFSAAAQENAASRVFAGIHFPTAVRTGCQLGEQVGSWVFEHALPAADDQNATAASIAGRR